MSLIGNGSNKEKKKGKQAGNKSKSSLFTPQSSVNSKSAQRNIKLTGGANRGS